MCSPRTPPVAGRLRPSVQPRQPRPLFHVAGEQDPQVRFSDQEAAIEIAIDVNGVGASMTRCGDGCAIYGSGTPAPVMTWIHSGGHVYPRGTSERVVSFFRIIPARPDSAGAPGAPSAAFPQGADLFRRSLLSCRLDTSW